MVSTVDIVVVDIIVVVVKGAMFDPTNATTDDAGCGMMVIIIVVIVAVAVAVVRQ